MARKRTNLLGIHPELNCQVQNRIWEEIWTVRLTLAFDHVNEMLKHQLNPATRCVLMEFLKRHGKA